VLAQDKEQVDVYEGGKLVKSVVFVVGMKEYFVNGETPGVKMDAAPFIQSGRTFVPIRYLGNALGVTDKYILWKSPKVTFKEPGFPVVELTVGKKQIKSSGVSRAMDVAPVLKSGRTYLPARFVAEALGYEVAWDPQNKVVVCWPKGEEKPDYSGILEYVGQQNPTPPTNQWPTTTEGIMELINKAKEPEWESWGPEDFSYIDPAIKQRIFNGTYTTGPRVMRLTVNDLKPNGIRLFETRALMDMKVSKEGVTLSVAVPQKGAVAMPGMCLIEEGNKIRYMYPAEAVFGPVVETRLYKTSEFFGYDEKDNELPPPPDMTRIPKVLVYYGEGTAFIIDNPIYKK